MQNVVTDWLCGVEGVHAYFEAVESETNREDLQSEYMFWDYTW